MVKTNYVTAEQFKRALKTTAENGGDAWYLIGYLQGMLDLPQDKENLEIIHQIMLNGRKEHK